MTNAVFAIIVNPPLPSSSNQVPNGQPKMPSVHTQPSVHSGPSRSTSPSPSRQHHQEPSEITNLLAPGPAPATPGPAFQNHSHLRKASVGGRSVSGRSVAGSIHRGYGSVNSKPGPASQAPRVSKLGQRVGPCRFTKCLSEEKTMLMSIAIADPDDMADSDIVLCPGHDGLSLVLPYFDPLGQHVCRPQRVLSAKPVGHESDGRGRQVLTFTEVVASASFGSQ